MRKESINFTGQRIGQCLVLGPVPKLPHHYQQVWRLLCDCGNECEKVEQQLKKPSPTTRCKACFAQAVSAQKRRHGETKNYLFQVWENMNRRCYDPGYVSSKSYGGRVFVFDAWRKDYVAFATWIRENIGERPSDRYSLDRKDNDGHYEPGNLRWATAKQQALNRRSWTWADDTPKRREIDDRKRAKALMPPAGRGRPRKPYIDPVI